MEKEKLLKLYEEKERQIKNILIDENMTYGMAKHIIQRIEADLSKEGEMFLRGSLLKNISPTE